MPPNLTEDLSLELIRAAAEPDRTLRILLISAVLSRLLVLAGRVQRVEKPLPDLETVLRRLMRES